MDFIKLNIGSNSSWSFKSRLHITNESGDELYYTSKPSIWKSDILIHDTGDKPVRLITSNAWSSKYEMFDISETKDLIAKINIKTSLKTRMVVESHTMGRFTVVSNSLLKSNFLIVDQNENEIAMFTRKLDGFKYHYGLAVREDSDLLLLASVVMLMEIRTKQGA